MKYPRISVIVPIYNVELYIEDCLNSVANQTYRGELECVLVDDCGQDNSKIIAEEFIDAYAGPINFNLVSHKHNMGLSAARNTGLAHSTGDYVYFLDSDDEMLPNAIEELTDPLLNNQYDMVIGDYKVVGSDRQFPKLLLSNGTQLFKTEILQTYTKNYWYVMAWNKLYRREFLQSNKISFYPGIIHEDILWSFHTAALMKSMYVVKTITYIYKVREGSITTDINFDKEIESLVVVLKEYNQYAVQYDLYRFDYVHRLIQKHRLEALSFIYKHGGSNNAFKDVYCLIRKDNKESIKQIILHNKFRVHDFIRDFHFLFPPFWGYYIERLFVYVHSFFYQI